jgi:hypothetical protein
MTTIESAATTIQMSGVVYEVEEAQLAAISFLARYSGRTLEAYRHDLRGFFQWATDHRRSTGSVSTPEAAALRCSQRHCTIGVSIRSRGTACGYSPTAGLATVPPLIPKPSYPR